MGATIITNALLAKLQDGSSGTIETLLPGSKNYDDRRRLRSGEFDIKPGAIALPKNGAEVARIVKWATAEGVKFTVRSGGNDFYGRSAGEGLLMIDMREMKDVEVSQDKKTARVGGGIISRDLVLKLEQEGVMTPTGNTWIVGYAGWVTNGGYGPLQDSYGMGYEQLVGAEIVNAEGELVEANEEQLEGFRGMVGNLGIVTTLTVKVYPFHEILSGWMMLESSDIQKTIRSYTEAARALPIPKELTVHHFVIRNPMGPGKIFAVSWTHPDVKEGQALLQTWKDAMPPLVMSTVEARPMKGHQELIPDTCGAKGGQRSLYIRRPPTAEGDDPVLAAVLHAVDNMPTDPGVNIAWSDIIDPKPTPPNCVAPAAKHCFFSCSYTVMDEKNFNEANEWSIALIKGLTSLGPDVVLDGAFPGLTPPSDRTAAQLYGIKWPRVKELKLKYDPKGVFGLAAPQITV